MLEALDTFQRFLNTYPMWAKIGIFAGLLVAGTIAIFVPREKEAMNQKNENTNGEDKSE